MMDTSLRITEAVAEKEGVPPEDLENQLYEAIDPDALDSIVREAAGIVQFEYMNYRITVSHDEKITVEEIE